MGAPPLGLPFCEHENQIRGRELTPKINLVCILNLPAFLEGVLQAKGLSLPGPRVQSSGRPNTRAVSLETRVTRGWGGTEVVDTPCGSLLQVGGWG